MMFALVGATRRTLSRRDDVKGRRASEGLTAPPEEGKENREKRLKRDWQCKEMCRFSKMAELSSALLMRETANKCCDLKQLHVTTVQANGSSYTR